MNIGHLLTGKGRDALPIDVTFLCEIFSAVKDAYEQAGIKEGVGIGSVQLVQIASEIYCDLSETYQTIDECRSVSKLVIRQLLRNISVD